MNYIEAPNNYDPRDKSLFLAGGITGCPDWQSEMLGKIQHLPITVFNPRRVNFPIDDPTAAMEQITWEFEHLRKAEAISFWFPHETMNPIVLYELGAWSMTNKKLFVGTHPKYQRLQDVVIQTKLARPDINVVDSLDNLANEVILWQKESKKPHNSTREVIEKQPKLLRTGELADKLNKVAQDFSDEMEFAPLAAPWNSWIYRYAEVNEAPPEEWSEVMNSLDAKELQSVRLLFEKLARKKYKTVGDVRTFASLKGNYQGISPRSMVFLKEAFKKSEETK